MRKKSKFKIALDIFTNTLFIFSIDIYRIYRISTDYLDQERIFRKTVKLQYLIRLRIPQNLAFSVGKTII